LVYEWEVQVELYQGKTRVACADIIENTKRAEQAHSMGQHKERDAALDAIVLLEGELTNMNNEIAKLSALLSEAKKELDAAGSVSSQTDAMVRAIKIASKSTVEAARAKKKAKQKKEFSNALKKARPQAVEEEDELDKRMTQLCPSSKIDEPLTEYDDDEPEPESAVLPSRKDELLKTLEEKARAKAKAESISSLADDDLAQRMNQLKTSPPPPKPPPPSQPPPSLKHAARKLEETIKNGDVPQ
jgi:hypothetical protein